MSFEEMLVYQQQLQIDQDILLRRTEPYIPSAMEDWDEAFWIATGIIIDGSTFGQVQRSRASYVALKDAIVLDRRLPLKFATW